MSDVYDTLDRAFAAPDRIALVRAVDVAMEALGASIASASVRDALDAVIDASLRVGLRAGAGRSPVHVDELYARVADASGLSPGAAIEVTQMFAAWLVDRLRPDLREALRDDLGADWSALLADPPARATAREPTHRRVPPMPGPLRTLADGAPGSQRPLATAQPRPGQPDSVAASDDPKADRKLSAGRPRDPSTTDRAVSRAEPGAGPRSLSRYED